MKSSPSVNVWVTIRGIQTRLNEKEFEEGLGSGRFSAGDLYWREGMASWQPVPVVSETETEKEPVRDPVAMIASMKHWTHWVRWVFRVAAGVGVLAIPFLAWFKANRFENADSIGLLLLAVLGTIVLIAFFVVGVAVYVIPAIWLYRICSAAQLLEKPQIPPQYVAIAWCVPLANMVVPVLALRSLSKAAGSSFPRAGWVIVGAIIVGFFFFALAGSGPKSADYNFDFAFGLNFFLNFYLLFDAARYLAWRKIAAEFSHKIEMKIRQSENISENPAALHS